MFPSRLWLQVPPPPLRQLFDLVIFQTEDLIYKNHVLYSVTRLAKASSSLFFLAGALFWRDSLSRLDRVPLPVSDSRRLLYQLDVPRIGDVTDPHRSPA